MDFTISDIKYNFEHRKTEFDRFASVYEAIKKLAPKVHTKEEADGLKKQSKLNMRTLAEASNLSIDVARNNLLRLEGLGVACYYCPSSEKFIYFIEGRRAQLVDAVLTRLKAL